MNIKLSKAILNKTLLAILFCVTPTTNSHLFGNITLNDKPIIKNLIVIRELQNLKEQIEIIERQEETTKFPLKLEEEKRNLIGTTVEKISLLLGIPKKIKREILGIKNIDEAAHIRFNTELCNEEKSYLKKRKSKIEQGLKQLLGEELYKELIPNNKKLPTIGFCCSGGGYRAMIATTGSLLGAEQIGLLDAATYFSGLSGSTWMMGPKSYYNGNLAEFKKQLQEKVSHGILPINPFTNEKIAPENFFYGKDLDNIALTFLRKILTKQGISSIDFYGAVLANKLLADFHPDTRQDLFISDTKEKIKDGSHIFPIYSAVEPNFPSKIWFEFTPFEAGSIELESFMPLWSFGSKFKHGWLKNACAENNLGFMMGIFGSAYDISLNRGINMLREAIIEKVESPIETISNYSLNFVKDKFVKAIPCFPGLKKFVQEKIFSDENRDLIAAFLGDTVGELLTAKHLVENTQYALAESAKVTHFNAGNLRFWPAELYNPLYKTKDKAYSGLEDESYIPLTSKKRLTFVDAGIAYNLPFQPLLHPERNTDLIIVCDVSDESTIGGVLKDAENHAKSLNQKFPEIDLNKIKENTATVFKDDDPETPVVIYFPLVKNSEFSDSFNPRDEMGLSYCNTFNFYYTKDQFDALCGLCEFNMKEKQEVIKNEIIEVIKNKK